MSNKKLFEARSATLKKIERYERAYFFPNHDRVPSNIPKNTMLSRGVISNLLFLSFISFFPRIETALRDANDLIPYLKCCGLEP